MGALQGVGEVHTTPAHRLGQVEKSGTKAYIYLQGVASTAAGSWVTYDENGVTTLLAANAKGPVAVATAATVASTYGWYQIWGLNEVAKCESAGMADNAMCYIDTTAGLVDDTKVVGDLVVGAVSRSTDTSGVFSVQLNYPYVTDAIPAA